ncbi:hypothetical protein ACH5RR_001739 [Cinchona calisaya]|uniref:F-box domain-containing protein n=1 Tax=Cinchona calisaya TaxID=153742 RepID=A0ABD3B4D1_9GENT
MNFHPVILSCLSWLLALWSQLLLALTRGRRLRASRHLPDEILVQILTKLPAKSVVRCRCVCRRWKALTSTPAFLELHQKNSNITRSITVNRWQSDWFWNRKKSTSHECTILNSFDCPVLKSSYPHKFLYSSNGLLIFLEEFPSNSRLQHFILLNPATRQKVRLVTPPGSIYGVFFHPLVKDHHQYCVLWGEESSSLYKLLVLRESCYWRELHHDVNGPVPWQPRLQTPPVIVNDVLYWMVGCRHGTRILPRHCGQSIMAFNTKTEKFSAMSHPGPQDQWCKEDPEHLRMHLLEMDDHGLLCLCECAELEPLITIWIYENSRSLWIRRHAVSVKVDISNYPFSKVRPVAFVNGEVYAEWPREVWGGGGSFAFNLVLGTVKSFRRLRMFGIEDETSVIIMYAHTPSLIPINNCETEIWM